MTQVDDLSRSLVAFEQDSTLVIVVEMSQSSWLAAGLVPGVSRQPLKKLEPHARDEVPPSLPLRVALGMRRFS